MSSSTLYPPNLCSFRDDVIGMVVPRSSPSFYVRSTPHTHGEPTYPKTTTEGDEPFGTQSPSKRRKTSQSTRKRGEISIELRRQRRRVNMQRYRHKIRDRAVVLEQQVQQLQVEIPPLQMQRDTLQAIEKGNTVWNVAAEYLRLFRHGLKDPQSVLSTTETDTSGISNAQRGFLNASLTPDVVGLSGYGVEQLLDDYRALALYLPSMNTQLDRLSKGVRGSVHATTEVEIVITENTLRLAFPHLVRGDNLNPVVFKLLGQRFVMRGSICFEWDSETNRVSLLQSKADLLTPMLELLGDLETVSFVFENALLTPECTPVRRK